MIAGVTSRLAGVDFRAALQRRTRQTMFAKDPGADKSQTVNDLRSTDKIEALHRTFCMVSL